MEDSRRSISRQVASRRAVTQHAVHPPAERSSKRQPGSITTRRQTVHPPVCEVQPGRSLELRTNLGLMRAKQLLQQQGVTETNDERAHVQKQSGNRSQLKSARLQPLGIVDDESISSQLCLGIIPESHRRSHKYQRPRTSTTPGVLMDLPNDGSRRLVKVRRRSHSAVLARTVDTEHLMKLLSVSKRTGFHPQNESQEINRERNFQSQSTHLKQVTTTSTLDSSQLKPLPQVSEIGMKIEIKGIQKHDESNEGDQLSTNTGSKRDSTKGSPGKLPPINTKEQPNHLSNQLSSQSSNSNDSTPKSRTDLKQSPASNHTSPMKVSIVSLGEGRSSEEQSKPKSRQRRSSGRLSYGWSPPQPIEPITGSPLSTPTRQSASNSPRRKSAKEDTLKEADRTVAVSLNSSMTISVDVHAFLEDK